MKQGERLADVFGQSDVFPALAVQLVRVGEEGGRLEGMLAKLADAYALEIEVTLKRLVALIEPALILLIGIFVGTIVASILAAILGINALAF